MKTPYGQTNPQEFAASDVLSDAERSAVQQTQFNEGYRAAALGRTVGTHEPVAVQAGAWAFEVELKAAFIQAVRQ